VNPEVESALIMWKRKIIIKIHGTTYGSRLENNPESRTLNKLNSADIVTLIKLCGLE
jgi:hypothetical protein